MRASKSQSYFSSFTSFSSFPSRNPQRALRSLFPPPPGVMKRMEIQRTSDYEREDGESDERKLYSRSVEINEDTKNPIIASNNTVLGDAERNAKKKKEGQRKKVVKETKEAREKACLAVSPQSKSIMATLLQDYDKATFPSNTTLDVQAEVVFFILWVVIVHFQRLPISWLCFPQILPFVSLKKIMILPYTLTIFFDQIPKFY